MNFEPMNFITNLKYMGVGMLGIFLVVGIIILSIWGLNEGMNKLAAKKAAQENDNNGEQ